MVIILVVCLLVLFSLLMGVFENIEPLFVPALPALNVQNGIDYLFTSEVLPLLSTAGFLAAIVVLMTIAQAPLENCVSNTTESVNHEGLVQICGHVRGRSPLELDEPC